MTSPARKRAERPEVARSRERILAEAESYFVERGIDAPLTELAARAEVGVATLFRRFPTQDDLIRALYDRMYERFDALYQTVPTGASGWEGISHLFYGAVEIVRQSPALPAVMGRMAQIDPTYQPGDSFVAPLSELVHRAQQEGSVRADVTGYDLSVAPLSVASLAVLPEPIGSLLVNRLAVVILDGFRAEGASPIPDPAEVDPTLFHRSIHGLNPEQQEHPRLRNAQSRADPTVDRPCSDPA